MSLEFLREFGQQLLSIWKEIKTYQKFTVIMVASLLVAMLVLLVANAAATRYTPLFPVDRLTITDAAEIKGYLDGLRVPYKIQSDTSIIVPENQVHRLRMDLAAVGLPKLHSGKGFELFDTNTWIKGEKELQVLEMRALKGQLERDIAEYENIKTANVILDIAPPRPFGGSMYKTKASVILNLMPGARLSSSQLRAITYHVAGAVRGLVPNMVAISDTTGKLYQAIDPEGDTDMLRSAEAGLEERIKSKVDGMLAMVVGADNFYSTVQVTMSRKKVSEERKIYSGVVNGVNLGDAVPMSLTESGMQMTEKERSEQGAPGSNNEAVAGAVIGGSTDLLNRSENRNQQYRQMAVPVDHVKMQSQPGVIEAISIGVLIDKTITVGNDSDLPVTDVIDGKRQTERIKQEILNQLSKIIEGHGVKAIPAVDFVEFDKTSSNKRASEESWGSIIDRATQVGTGAFIVITVMAMLWTFNSFWRKHMMQPPVLDKEEEEISATYTEEPSIIEVEAMIELIKTRLQSDPTLVIDSLKEWLVESNEFSIGNTK
ncbi:MAG: fliF [Chlamydiales bacterium]|jgi:flagellar M-ring protein FliF|nr:fliF [Chlamydiales bacterium]